MSSAPELGNTSPAWEAQWDGGEQNTYGHKEFSLPAPLSPQPSKGARGGARSREALSLLGSGSFHCKWG